MTSPDRSSGNAQSIWLQEVKRPSYPSLTDNVSCDVCVVGAGIAGLTTAYLAAREGLSVVLVEDGEIGSGETGRTSAHLTNVLDDRYYVLEEKHGKEGARLAAESHAAAINEVERIVSEEKIECQFERVEGYLFVPPESDQSELEKEFEAAQRAGIPVLWAPKSPWKSYDTGRCLQFPRQAQFHPLKYLSALASKMTERGVRIFTHTHVTEILSGKELATLTKSGHKVTAKHIVIATNVPINDRVVMHTKQAAYRSYVIAAPLPRGAVPHALYWDTPDPYHYIRLEMPEGESVDEMLIIGGEDHRTGQKDDTETPYRELEAWARERFPTLKQVEYRWSGQIIDTIDGLAFIGRNPLDDSNVYIATGDCGNGLTHGTIAGLLITDLIQGRPNAWASLYDPKRKTISAAGEFIKGILNVVPQYLDWLTPGSVKAVKDIKPGCGEVLREGVKKIAVYRDSQGTVHACSAVCPHLGGLVRWNADENSWDCPAHGSRFDPLGKVMNGPANSNLESLQDKKGAGTPALPDAISRKEEFL